jgi:hypothetical protein
MAAATPAPSGKVPAAEAALAAGDFRVYEITGVIPQSFPGLLCVGDDMRSLRNRGGIFYSDVSSEPDRHDLPMADLVRFNLRLGADRRFQAATGCRAKSICELRFREPDAAAAIGLLPQGVPPGEHLDRQCLHEPAQLAAVAKWGAPATLKVLLSQPPKAWRNRSGWRDLDAYGAALVDAAGEGRADMVAILLPWTRTTARLSPTAPATPVERAILATLDPGRAAERSSAFNAFKKLFATRPRLEFNLDGKMVSLLGEALARSSVSDTYRLSLVDLLLARGADPNGPSCKAGLARGSTPLKYVSNTDPVFAKLKAAGARQTSDECPGAGPTDGER